MGANLIFLRHTYLVTTSYLAQSASTTKLLNQTKQSRRTETQSKCPTPPRPSDHLDHNLASSSRCLLGPCAERWSSGLWDYLGEVLMGGTRNSLTGCGRTSGLRRTLGRGVVRAEDGCAWTA